MDRFTRFWLLLILGMLPGLTEAAAERPPRCRTCRFTPTAPLAACCSTVAKGFEDTPAALEDDLRALNAAPDAYPTPPAHYAKAIRNCWPGFAKVRASAPPKTTCPGFPLQMSKALRDFLTAVRPAGRRQPGRTAGQGRIPCRAIPAAPISAPSKSPANSRIPTRRDERHRAGHRRPARRAGRQARPAVGRSRPAGISGWRCRT